MKRAVIIVGLGLMGCGGANPAIQASLADTQAAIRGAQEAGASEAPQARYHLELANEQVADAQRLEEEGQEDRAKAALARAQADAELAVAMAHEHETRQQAELAQRRIQELREQNL